MPYDDRLLKLLSLSLIAAQRVEFRLYGLAAHVQPDAAEKRFKDLTPERFLRGDVAELKATLGQLTRAYGDKFFISTEDLTSFVESRNLIAHNYYRTFILKIAGTENREDGIPFLESFLLEAQRWDTILAGLNNVMREAAAKAQGKAISFTPAERESMDAYISNAARHKGVELSD